MSVGDVVVGLDLGTSALKAVAVDAEGRVLARARASYATIRPLPGRAEQSPADWEAAVGVAVRGLAGEVASERWAAVGLSGMIPTLVTLDARGRPLGPAITWEDTRAKAEGERLRARIGGNELYRRTGQWLDGRYLLPMFAWLRHFEPERAAATAMVASAKDYLFAWLTGESATDPSTASGFGCYELGLGRWSDELASLVGVTASDQRPGLPKLPPIVASSATATLSPPRAAELGLPNGLPICLGAADSVAGALGLGAMESGQVAYVAGTSTVILAASPRPVFDDAHRYLVTPPASGDGCGLEMDLLSTGASIRWLADLFGMGERGSEDMLELARRAELGAAGVWFAPYLGFGEQGALWDPALRGAMGGLTTAHGRAEIARALVEGIVLESRRCIGVLDETGIPRREIVAAGPAARSGFFRAMLADGTGRAVRWHEQIGDEASAFGAALLAAEALGQSLPAMRTASTCEVVEPSPGAATLWSELWERHERVRAAARSADAVEVDGLDS